MGVGTGDEGHWQIVAQSSAAVATQKTLHAEAQQSPSIAHTQALQALLAQSAVACSAQQSCADALATLPKSATKAIKQTVAIRPALRRPLRRWRAAGGTKSRCGETPEVITSSVDQAVVQNERARSLDLALSHET